MKTLLLIISLISCFVLGYAARHFVEKWLDIKETFFYWLQEFGKVLLLVVALGLFYGFLFVICGT